MNRDPFLRLALIVSVSAYAVAIAVVWRELGWGAAVAGMVAGPAGALALSVEKTDSPDRTSGDDRSFFPHRPRMPFRRDVFVDDELEDEL